MGMELPAVSSPSPSCCCQFPFSLEEEIQNSYFCHVFFSLNLRGRLQSNSMKPSELKMEQLFVLCLSFDELCLQMMDVVLDHCLFNQNKTFSFHRWISFPFQKLTKRKKKLCNLEAPLPTISNNGCYLGIYAFWQFQSSVHEAYNSNYLLNRGHPLQ